MEVWGFAVKEEWIRALILLHVFFPAVFTLVQSHSGQLADSLELNEAVVVDAAWIQSCTSETGGSKPCLETPEAAFKWQQLRQVAVSRRDKHVIKHVDRKWKNAWNRPCLRSVSYLASQTKVFQTAVLWGFFDRIPFFLFHLIMYFEVRIS